jgi:hypothetical protein
MAAKPSKPAKYKVTAAHAAEFQRYVAKWQRVLNLGNWRITVSHIRSKRDVMAEVYKTDLEQRMAVFRLAAFFHYPVTSSDLEKTAIHELLHIFLLLFKTWAMQPGANEEDIDSEEHGVINVLEELLYATRKAIK